MSLLAVRPSHRGVRLHTFEPEDRAYLSTPTKIGGHCLDHIRNGLTLTWRRSLNYNPTTTKDIRGRNNSSRHGQRGNSSTDSREMSTDSAEEVPAAYSTTLDPSMGRFGGLGGVVLKLRSQRRNETPRTTAARLPLYPNLEELPPDTLATRDSTSAVVAAVSRRQQQQQQHQAYGPEWPDVAVGGEAVDWTVAPHDGASSMPAAQMRRDLRAPYRNVTASATGHSGALMAILLSKLANSGGSDSSGGGDGGDLNATVGGGAGARTSPEAYPSALAGHNSNSSGDDGIALDVACAGLGEVEVSPSESLRFSVNGIAQGLDYATTTLTDTSTGGRGSGSWAWTARVEQTPRYSKLRRYDFVRELGSGSHGTVMLVRKRCPGGGGARSGALLGAKDDCGVGSTSHRPLGNSGGGRRGGDISGSGGGSSSSGEAGGLRVLKESQFLPEAVNEARLLLLAGGGGGSSASGGATSEAGASNAAASATAPDGAPLAGASGSAWQAAGAVAARIGAGAGVGGVGEIASSGNGDSDRRGGERGKVVQLHDFFVETVGHRSLAFLELEYCEGGDLRDLILGAHAASVPAPAAVTASSGAPQLEGAGGGGRGGGGGVKMARKAAALGGATASATAGAAARQAMAEKGGGGEAAGVPDVVADGASCLPAQHQEEPYAGGIAGGHNGGDAGGSFGMLTGAKGTSQRFPEEDSTSTTAWRETAARRGFVGLSAAQIGRVTLGLCEGLQWLHERGVVHRDLKPANVLLTKSGAVRVADLGVSTSLDPSRPLTEHAAGTVPFMAPEVRKYLLGAKIAYSGKADVWAVGALVYAMSVGNPAPEELATQPRSQLVSAVGHQTRSEALSLVAHRALDPDPSRRPSVHQMTSMLHDLCEREGWLSPRSPPGRKREMVPMAKL